ncbi:MAG: prepilin peptidase [Nitrososphaera sp.]|uniref:prepilin peptidase n=1 Tax=Nitrososphaera sp. TaxID=1971748 RepID=UPI003D6DF166
MYADLLVVRVCIALAMFAVAAAVDMKKREVDDRLWLAFAGPAAALYFFDYGNIDTVTALLSAGLGAGASFALYRTGLFGGADALAIIALAVILPTYDGRFMIAGVAVHPLSTLTLLSNAVVLSSAHLAFNVARNTCYWARHGDLFAGMEETKGRKAMAMLLGHRSSGRGFAFLMESKEGGSRRFDFALKNTEDAPFESKKDVWVMPGMPFLAYMLAGLAAMVFAGDLAFGLLSLFS